MRRPDAVAIPTTRPGHCMQADLREFLSRFAGTVVMTLVPVVLIAFLSVPVSLGGHPGESTRNGDAPFSHMT